MKGNWRISIKFKIQTKGKNVFIRKEINDKKSIIYEQIIQDKLTKKSKEREKTVKYVWWQY